MPTILALNGSYRDDGITDQAVEIMADTLRSVGAQVEVILLREYPLEFCRNCRACAQEPGEAPGTCVLDDGMDALVEKIEQADGYILAAPTNFYSVTALFKRFMERLTVYGDWPWGAPAPRFRKARAAKKKAVLVSSCAAPGIMGRWMYHSRSQLKMTAKTIGAAPVGTLFTGLVASHPRTELPEPACRRARALAAKLLP